VITRIVSGAALCCLCLIATPGVGADEPPPPAGVLFRATPKSAPALTEACADGAVRLGQLLWGAPIPEALAGCLVRPLLPVASADAALASSLALDRVYVVSCPDGVSADRLAQDLRELPALRGSVEGVWIDDVTTLHTDDDGGPAPNDPYFPDQYSLRNTGQSVEGHPGIRGADINILGAWRDTVGDAAIVVAVLDAGVSQSHPDLAGKLVPGWNCLNHNYQTDDQYTSHGTHVAGIIGAATENRRGVAGIGWLTRLMPIVVVNKYGFGSESSLAEGLIWAADHGAEVASVSLGFNPPDGSDEDQVLRAAVLYATARGMTICASAGNTPDERIAAPARYPEVVAVGATDNRDELWSGTSTGPEMDLAAPGVAIWSTWDTIWRGDGENTYASKTGTSQACPHAAGVAALVLAVDPRLTPAEVRSILGSTAADLGAPGWDERYGAGRLDAGAAVRAARGGKGAPVRKDAVCIADFNNDGVVDSQDLVHYLSAFASEHRRADIAEPFGEVDIQDLIAFLDAHAQGCES